MHVCFFDIDGTLLSTAGAGQAAMEAALRSEFGFTGCVEGITTAGRTDRAIVRDLIGYCGIEPTDDVFRRFYLAYLQQLPGRLQNGRGTVLPGIVELLDVLQGRAEMLVGLLTGNFREGARLKLSHFAIHGYFTEVGGFGDEHEERDDVAREAYRMLHQRLDGAVDMGRVWVVGDTPADIRCARAIGARSFAVASGTYPLESLEAERPDCAVPSLSDPQALLSLLD